MLRYLLDADICIHAFRSRTPDLRDRFVAHEGELALSTVTLMELLFGAEKSARVDEGRREVAAFVARLTVLAYDDAAAAHTGHIRAALDRAGQRIGGYDVMIAGHARALGLIVASGNVGEFARVHGICCEDWIRGAP